MNLTAEPDLADEISAFLRSRDSLVASKEKPWVVFSEAKFVSSFDSYGDAFEFVVAQLLDKPFLIRELQSEPAFVPLVMVAR